MIAFIDDHREVYGVEPICRVLPIAPSTYHAHVAQRADPAKASPRARQDLLLMEQIQRVQKANFGVYGARKVWRQLGREGIAVARCTVERLMRQMGLRGAVRGKETRTTIADKASPCPADKVNRQFWAPHPNALWVSGFTYVATWQGFVYVAFVIDVFARRIVGWRVSRTAHADFVLDALEQALHDRRPTKGGLIHHSDRGSQYVAIRTQSGCSVRRIRRTVSSPPSAASATAMPTRSPRPSMGYSRRRWSGAAAPGAPWRPSSSPPSSGWTGTTTAASSSRSATCRPPRPRRATMPPSRRLR